MVDRGFVAKAMAPSLTLCSFEMETPQQQHHHHLQRPGFLLNYTALYFRIGYFMKASPFNWPVPAPAEATQLYSPLVSIPRRWFPVWYLVTAQQITYILFLYVSLYVHFQDYFARGQLLAAVLHLAWCCGHSVIACIRMHQLQCKNAMLRAANQMMRFVADAVQSEAEADAYLPRWRNTNKLMLLCCILWIFGGFSASAFALFFPYHHRYYYRHVMPGDSEHLTQGTRIGFWIWDWIFCYYAWFCLFTENFLALFIVDNMGTSLRVLNKKKASAEDPIATLRQTYQQLRILNTLFDDAFASAFGLPATKLTNTLTALACIAIAIKLAHRLNIILIGFLCLASVSTLGVIILMLPLSAKVYEKSTAFCFPNFGHRGQRLDVEERLLIRSCKPFAVQMGGLYMIDKSTALTYLSIFVANLINILIVMESFAV